MASYRDFIDTTMKMTETRLYPTSVLKVIMVCYDRIIHNSLGDLIQFVYRKDSMDSAGAFIEQQNIDTFSLNNKEFEHNYWAAVTSPIGSFLPGVLRW